MKPTKWYNVHGCVNGEIEITFKSSGSYEPPSYDCPGGTSEDRELVSVTIQIGKHEWNLPEDRAREIFDLLHEEVCDEELEPNEPDDDDAAYERMRDREEDCREGFSGKDWE